MQNFLGKTKFIAGYMKLLLQEMVHGTRKRGGIFPVPFDGSTQPACLSTAGCTHTKWRIRNHAGEMHSILYFSFVINVSKTFMTKQYYKNFNLSLLKNVYTSAPRFPLFAASLSNVYFKPKRKCNTCLYTGKVSGLSLLSLTSLCLLR